MSNDLTRDELTHLLERYPQIRDAHRLACDASIAVGHAYSELERARERYRKVNADLRQLARATLDRERAK